MEMNFFKNRKKLDEKKKNRNKPPSAGARAASDTRTHKEATRLDEWPSVHTAERTSLASTTRKNSFRNRPTVPHPMPIILYSVLSSRHDHIIIKV